jgi:hypothetical protein
MSDRKLREGLIRLAHTHPEFRKDLLPLITAADGGVPFPAEMRADADPKAKDQSKDDHWNGLDPKKPAIGEPALPPKVAAWENLPPGWTQDSVQSMWDSLVGDVKHKITKCMEQMKGNVDDPGAFCGSLASQVGYRAASAGRDASLLRRASIRVAHEDVSLRPALLPMLSKKA